MTRTWMTRASMTRGLPYVPDLIAAKAAGEHRTLDAASATGPARPDAASMPSRERLAGDVARLTAQLEAARDGSALRERTSAGAALNDLVVRARLKAG